MKGRGPGQRSLERNIKALCSRRALLNQVITQFGCSTTLLKSKRGENHARFTLPLLIAIFFSCVVISDMAPKLRGRSPRRQLDRSPVLCHEFGPIEPRWKLICFLSLREPSPFPTVALSFGSLGRESNVGIICPCPVVVVQRKERSCEAVHIEDRCYSR